MKYTVRFFITFNSTMTQESKEKATSVKLYGFNSKWKLNSWIEQLFNPSASYGEASCQR